MLGIGALGEQGKQYPYGYSYTGSWQLSGVSNGSG